ncbi:MAG TPA: LamG domain-containing protein, partial [Methylococcales bacterium]
VFDGNNDYLTLSAPPADSTNISTGSVFAWVKTPYAGDGFRGIVIKKSAYGMYIYGNEFGIFTWDGAAFLSSGANVSDGQWHLVGFTFQSGVANGTKLYVDGVEKVTTTMTVVDQMSPLVIGAGESSQQFFTGSIDQVLLYDKILTAEDVMSLYRNDSQAPAAPANSLFLHNFTSDAVNGAVSYSDDGYYNSSVNGPTPPTWTVNGKSNGAFVFNGTNNYIYTPNLDAKQFTVSGWIKRDRVNAPNNEGIISTSSCGGWGLGIGTNNTLYLSQACSSAVGSTGAITDTNWHHVAATFDGSLVIFYIDGTEAGRVDNYSPIFKSDGAVKQYHIGAAWLPYSEFFKGNMDDISFYNRALSAGEIMNLFGQSSDTSVPSGNPVVWYDFNADDTGGGAYNHSGYPYYDATKSGGTFPTWTADGKSGGGFNFNGISDYVGTDNLDANQFTFSTWVKRGRTSTFNPEGIIEADKANGWGMGIDPGNTLYFEWEGHFR